ncbi:MAG TPA: hypothetical protein VMT95_07860 [Candidatus Binatia bacterium]|nr:hypothetical protein [Candidatus Binatia bacterium]
MQRALLVAFLGLAVYLAVAAYYGFVVGQTIRKAEASNPMLRIAATMVGKTATEDFTIRRMGVPNWIVHAPTFWLTLRMNE